MNEADCADTQAPLTNKLNHHPRPLWLCFAEYSVSILLGKQEIFQWSDFTASWSSSLSNTVLYPQLGRRRVFVGARTFTFEYNNVTKCLAVRSLKKCRFRFPSEDQAEAKIKSNLSRKLPDTQTVLQKKKIYIYNEIKIFMQLRLGFHTPTSERRILTGNRLLQKSLYNSSPRRYFRHGKIWGAKKKRRRRRKKEAAEAEEPTR